jgi:hypothetical protein
MCSPMIFDYLAQIAIVCSPIVAEIYCVTGARCSGPNLPGFQPNKCRLVFDPETGKGPPEYPDFIFGSGAKRQTCFHCNVNNVKECDVQWDKNKVVAAKTCSLCSSRNEACIYAQVKHPPYLLGFAAHPVPGFEYLQHMVLPINCDGCKGAKQSLTKCSRHPPPGGCTECVRRGKQCHYTLPVLGPPQPTSLDHTIQYVENILKDYEYSFEQENQRIKKAYEFVSQGVSTGVGERVQKRGGGRGMIRKAGIGTTRKRTPDNIQEGGAGGRPRYSAVTP